MQMRIANISLYVESLLGTCILYSCGAIFNLLFLDSSREEYGNLF